MRRYSTNIICRNSREEDRLERLGCEDINIRKMGDAMMPSNKQKSLDIFCFCSLPFFGGLRIVIRTLSRDNVLLLLLPSHSCEVWIFRACFIC
jgi:hypothetical protein